MNHSCLQCGSDMVEQFITISRDKGGQTFAVTSPGLACTQCDYQTFHATQIDAYKKQLADKYRQSQGLLTSDQIKKLRHELGMSQEQFSSFLHVGIASVKRWELGGIQERSMDKLIRMACSNAVQAKPAVRQKTRPQKVSA